MADFVDRLVCPRSGAPLILDGDALVAADRASRYPLRGGVPDLRRAPERFSIDVPWYEPWEDLGSIRFDRPAPLHADDLPYRLDPHLASVPSNEGRGRWLLEIGCGERQCEPYFTRRNFHYVGMDVDIRGPGPNVLGDAHNLPFRDASFDLACSMAVYQHLPAPLIAAKETFRILREGGTFFGTSAFVYGWTDRASFNHMSHAGLVMMLRTVGFDDVRVWSDWSYGQSIANMSFNERGGRPWRVGARAMLGFMEWTFTRTSNMTRKLVGKDLLDLERRSVETAGSLTFVARKPHGMANEVAE